MRKTNPNPDRAPDAELQERLIDHLLREELGADVPPDLTDRIMMQVRGRQANAAAARHWGGGMASGWRTWWLPSAVAALIVVGVGLWLMNSGPGPSTATYPGVAATGSFTVAGGGDVRPGATLVTTPAQEAQVTLGGYAEVKIAPDSRLKIVSGDQFKESVYLEAGEATTHVEKKRGEFAVVTEHLRAAVTGTRFSVRVSSDLDPKTGLSVRRSTVKVIEGSVDVLLPTGNTVPLKAGGTMTFPAPPTAPEVASVAVKPVVPPPPPVTKPIAVRPAPEPPKTFEPISRDGEVHLIGRMAEAPDGWYLTERSGRRTLLMHKADYPKSGLHFIADGEYVVIFREGKFTRAMRVGASEN